MSEFIDDHKMFWSTLRTPWKIVLSIVIFGGTFGIIFIIDNFSAIFVKREIVNASYELLSSEIKPVVALQSIPEPPEVKDKQNPINGELMTKTEYEKLISRHPIAISVNNFTKARPQYGLSKADEVMEVLVEGGITRYVPVFYGNYDVAKVGPVRSLRYYMIEFAGGFGDAIILHHGWAGYEYPTLGKPQEKTDARAAVFRWHVKSLQTAGSTYRDMQKAKKDGYVHSLYTDFGRIVPEIARLQKSYGWKLGGEVVEPLKFKFDGAPGDRGKFKSVSVNFMSINKADYTARFVYNKETNNYERFIAGAKDMDLLTGKQIAPKNVVIEWHNYSDAVPGGGGRLIIDMLGKDKVSVLRDGKIINGYWQKDCRTCRTKYYTDDGKEIELNRGQIWDVIAIKVGNRKITDVNFE